MFTIPENRRKLIDIRSLLKFPSGKLVFPEIVGGALAIVIRDALESSVWSSLPISENRMKIPIHS